jgi:molecular chaperone IbpA
MRPFTRKFTLADNVEVKNAEMINGILKIVLEALIPEEKKPVKIEIKEGN